MTKITIYNYLNEVIAVWYTTSELDAGIFDIAFSMGTVIAQFIILVIQVVSQGFGIRFGDFDTDTYITHLKAWTENKLDEDSLSW